MKNPDTSPISPESLRRAGVPQQVTPDSPATGAAAGAAAGAATGAMLGAFAGPPGAVVGAIVGAVAGAASGAALAGDHDQELLDAQLDEEIGLNGGPMGAASPNAPKSVRGTFSGGSAGAGGAGGSDAAPDEGPMPSAT
ncbi:MAG: hypothetical protein JWP97_2760 [Labilithrix sp.]|nr:hypothetical protein [Labilithrix sp.]